ARASASSGGRTRRREATPPETQRDRIQRRHRRAPAAIALRYRLQLDHHVALGHESSSPAASAGVTDVPDRKAAPAAACTCTPAACARPAAQAPALLG